MNSHSDKWIMNRLQEHYEISKEHFPENQIIGIFLQGSQNYGMDYSDSDIDSKLIVLPTLKDIALNKKPVSTTHIDPATEEHIDFKDIRLMFQTFKKQNLNFVEILFTKYCILNPMYEKLWKEFISYNDTIVQANPVATLKTMKGIALEKYHAMEHRYPSKIAVIDHFGYDPKQLHHLCRVYEFMQNFFIKQYSYSKCLEGSDWVKSLKDPESALELSEARKLADKTKEKLENLYELCMLEYEKNPRFNKEAYDLIDDYQYKFIETGILNELKAKGELEPI